MLPFYGYARQDRKDQPRVPITAKLVANLLVAAGANRVLTMDLHAQQIQGFFDIPVDHLYSLPVLIKYLREVLTGKTVVVSPDIGGLKMASAYAEALGANSGCSDDAFDLRKGGVHLGLAHAARGVDDHGDRHQRAAQCGCDDTGDASPAGPARRSAASG